MCPAHTHTRTVGLCVCEDLWASMRNPLSQKLHRERERESDAACVHNLLTFIEVYWGPAGDWPALDCTASPLPTWSSRISSCVFPLLGVRRLCGLCIWYAAKHTELPLFNSQRDGIQTDKRMQRVPLSLSRPACVCVCLCVYCQQINQCLFAK